MIPCNRLKSICTRFNNLYFTIIIISYPSRYISIIIFTLIDSFFINCVPIILIFKNNNTTITRFKNTMIFNLSKLTHILEPRFQMNQATMICINFYLISIFINIRWTIRNNFLFNTIFTDNFFHLIVTIYKRISFIWTTIFHPIKYKFSISIAICCLCHFINQNRLTTIHSIKSQSYIFICLRLIIDHKWFTDCQLIFINFCIIPWKVIISA